jgi:segregation and condensation protein A
MTVSHQETIQNNATGPENEQMASSDWQSNKMTADAYQIKLTNIFEGPMDLLFHLVKKNEVDIYDIPIATITEQYLEYLEWLKSLNIELAGEFLVMASTLMHIKSKMLLPSNEEDEEDEEDPRLEIARPLMEYLQIKSAAEDLSQRPLLGDKMFVRTTAPVDGELNDEDQYADVGLFDLIDAFQRILANIAPEQRVELSADRISVKDKISSLIDLLEQHQSLTFEELFPTNPQKDDIIVTFLAILEMVKLYLIKLVQHTQTGVIRLFYQ